MEKQDLLVMDPEEIFEWDSDKLDVGLKVLDITIGKNWSKSKKAYELNKALKELNPTTHVAMSLQPQDPNLMMFQAL